MRCGSGMNGPSDGSGVCGMRYGSGVYEPRGGSGVTVGLNQGCEE